jgi:hypothetical protein
MTPEELARYAAQNEAMGGQLGLTPQQGRLLTVMGQLPPDHPLVRRQRQEMERLRRGEARRDFGQDLAGAVTGVTGASEAGRNLAEAEAEGNPTRAAGAVAQGAAAAVPFSRLGRAMLSTLPRAAGLGAGIGASGAVASGQLFSEAEAAEPQRRKPPSPTGAKPPAPTSTPPSPAAPAAPEPAPAAAASATGDQRQQTVRDLKKQIADTQAKLEKMATTHYESTTARKAASQPLLDEIEAARARITKIEDEFATEAAATRKSQERWRERNPDLAANWAWMVPAAAAAAGGATAGAQRLGRFLYNVPWHHRVRRAERLLESGSPLAGPALRDLGNRADEFAKPGSRLAGAMTSDKLPAVVGAAAGAELGMLPLQIDINNLGFSRALDSPWELAKAGITGGMAALTGGSAGKVVGAAIPKSQPPVEASRALAAELTPKGQRETRRLLDAMTAARPQPTPPTPQPVAPTPQPPPTPNPATPIPQPPTPPPARGRRKTEATPTSNPSPELQALEAELANVPADQRLAYIMSRLLPRNPR